MSWNYIRNYVLNMFGFCNLINYRSITFINNLCNYFFLIDEPGMFVGQIKKNDPSREFHGYVDKKSSENKSWHDVFHKGDSVFVSGKYLLIYLYLLIIFQSLYNDY